MKMFIVRIRTLFLIIGVFYFSEGKVCPEKTKSHKTRCEMYYECVDLPAEKHVWIPKNCEKGLVYVHNLKVCALPSDDWECTLGDIQNQNLSDKINQVHGFDEINGNKIANDRPKKDSDILIYSNNNQESNIDDRQDDGKVQIILKSTFGNDGLIDTDQDLIESSGDGIDFSDGFLEVENKEANENSKDIYETNMPSHANTPSEPSSTPKVDPSLTAHLQHLSQLIDGLKKKYQNRDKSEADLTPDQLNAFLAHFNIKNKFDTLDLKSTDEEKIVPGSTPPSIPVVLSNSSKERVPNKFAPNRAELFQKISNKLKPETKVVLSSSLPKRYGSLGFSNSQIVVNRPEGSVVFSIPPYGNEGNFIDHSTNYDSNSPKISEETLKTVLELSKQMIETQNVPKVISNPPYFAQPIIQPLFYTLSGSSPITSPFSSYFDVPANTHKNYGYDSATLFNNNKSHDDRNKYERPQNYYNGKPGTTIIHNNVMPVHVTSTSSGEKEIVDSYGQSLGLYPPLGVGENGNNNKGYSYQVSHHYENNKFVTTVRPYASATFTNQYASAQFPSPPLESQPTPNTVAQYYTPSPHLSENNVNSLFKTPDRYHTMHYENIQRPMNPQRPDSNRGTYQQLERPSSYSSYLNKPAPFSGQIDIEKVSIYPNSEKFESMETEDQSISLNKYSNINGQHSQTLSNEAQYGQQSTLENSPSSLQGYTSNLNKNPYLPRPPNSMYANNLVQSPNKPKFSPGENSQLVNIGGNFISYEVFQNSVLPLIGQQTGNANADFGNLEIISCQAGVRQANVTDCTRYYVCSKKDGKVLSYSCPPYTAFNKLTRICDARTYAVCAPDAVLSSYTVSENKRIQLEAIQAINEANRRRAETIKAQNLANLVNKYNEQLSAQQPFLGSQSNMASQNNDDKNVLDTYVQQAESLSNSASLPVQSSTTTKQPKKRKYYCKEGDKVPDQTSIYNYFICYKTAQGMKGHKMTCSKNLLFCPATSMCTLPTKCA